MADQQSYINSKSSADKQGTVHSQQSERVAIATGIEAQAETNTYTKQRDTARLQRDQFLKQRDQAREQRDLFRKQRDEARLKLDDAAKKYTQRKSIEDLHKSYPRRHERVGNHIAAVFKRAGLESGRILEVGGRDNPYRSMFSEFDYANLDLSQTGPGVVLGDITSCPQIPDNSYDAVISVDLFEHIDRPWLAADEIVRLLKPNGIAYHSTLFSWRYHPCPIDYWRFTPACLKFLFKALNCIEADFDDLERRRNIRGKGKFQLEPDAFGGWRENWRVFYAGRKNA